jgi:hypothetical protein
MCAIYAVGLNQFSGEKNIDCNICCDVACSANETCRVDKVPIETHRHQSDTTTENLHPATLSANKIMIGCCMVTCTTLSSFNFLVIFQLSVFTPGTLWDPFKLIDSAVTINTQTLSNSVQRCRVLDALNLALRA